MTFLAREKYRMTSHYKINHPTQKLSATFINAYFLTNFLKIIKDPFVYIGHCDKITLLKERRAKNVIFQRSRLSLASRICVLCRSLLELPVLCTSRSNMGRHTISLLWNWFLRELISTVDAFRSVKNSPLHPSAFPTILPRRRFRFPTLPTLKSIGKRT